MKHISCDRCGRDVQDYEPAVLIEVFEDNDDTPNEYDLCQGCGTSFDEWLRDVQKQASKVFNLDRIIRNGES